MLDRHLLFAVIISSFGCGETSKHDDSPSSSQERPQQLVGHWVYVKSGRVIGSIQFEASGRLIQGYQGDFTRFARWLGGGPEVSGVDTLSWAIAQDQGATRMCFSGNLIGQKLCFAFTQISVDRIRIGYPGDEYVRVVQSAGGTFTGEASRDNETIAALKTDLRILMTAQEAYFIDHAAYANDWNLLKAKANAALAAGNAATMVTASNGFTITVANSSTGGGLSKCTVQVGADASSAIDGVIVCVP